MATTRMSYRSGFWSRFSPTSLRGVFWLNAFLHSSRSCWLSKYRGLSIGPLSSSCWLHFMWRGCIGWR